MQKAAAVEGKRQLRSTLWMKAALKSSGRREENLTFALIPLVRAKRLNIYIYIQDGENIQRPPRRNTIIKKTNTYLILSTHNK
jgi:hypothetical protein